jgi:hypothetical protein
VVGEGVFDHETIVDVAAGYAASYAVSASGVWVAACACTLEVLGLAWLAVLLWYVWVGVGHETIVEVAAGYAASYAVSLGCVGGWGGGK